MNLFRTKEDLRPLPEDNDSKTSSEFTCKCGKQKGWITDGEVHKIPCPECGRVYRGQYNPKTLTIDAIELKP